MAQEGGNGRRPKAARRTTEEIKSIISDYENSGLSLNDYSKLHQLNKVYLTRWMKRHNNPKPSKGFVAVRAVKEPAILKEVLFAEYRGIRFYQAVDPSYLKALVS